MPVHNESLIDAPVENGTTATYQWIVAADNGPADNDLSTVAYSYSSNVNPVGDLYAGLFGALIVARPVSPRPLPAQCTNQCLHLWTHS